MEVMLKSDLWGAAGKWVITRLACKVSARLKRAEHLMEVVSGSDFSLGTLFPTGKRVREYHANPKGYNPLSLEGSLENKVTRGR
ncbi:hypothetical protein ACFXTO_034804 [Malus domestica]